MMLNDHLYNFDCCRALQTVALAVLCNSPPTHPLALTPSPDLGSEARKHDYVLLLPDSPAGEPVGKSKKPPTVPRPYHETHTYANTSRPLR